MFKLNIEYCSEKTPLHRRADCQSGFLSERISNPRYDETANCAASIVGRIANPAFFRSGLAIRTTRPSILILCIRILEDYFGVLRQPCVVGRIANPAFSERISNPRYEVSRITGLCSEQY
jgi:hypothetical protein